MKYMWNKKRILLTYLLSVLRKDNNDIQIYQTLLRTLNNQETKKDLTIRENKNIDHKESILFYKSCLEYINDDLYNDITDMYTWFDNLDIFNDDYQYHTLPINNDTLYEIVYAILETFNNKDILKYYSKLLHEGYINITNTKDILRSSTESLGGYEIYDYYLKKGYINVYRKNTIEDIEILLHEFMHSYFHHLIKPDKKDFDLLPELDGQFGTLYSYKYLTENNFCDALLLRKNAINSILIGSYLMMINHLIILHNFDLNKVNDSLENLNLINKPIILESELKDYLSINGFTTASNTISYLSVLDLLNANLSNEEILERIKLLRYNSTEAITSNLSRVNEISFYKDGYKNLFKEYNLTHK